MKKLLMLQLMISICIGCYAQDTRKSDSLWVLYKKAKQDTVRIKLYLDIGSTYESENPDTALLFYTRALSLSEKHTTDLEVSDGAEAAKFFFLQTMSLLNLGLHHVNQGNYDKAISCYLKSLAISDELGNLPDKATAKAGKYQLIKCYNNIGKVYYIQGLYDKANEYFQKSFKTNEKLGDRKGMSDCYNNIGALNYSQGKYDIAIDYFLKSLTYGNPDDKSSLSKSYNNIGTVYVEQGSDSKAIKYFSKSLKIREELDDKQGMSGCYNNMGAVYFQQGDNDNAIASYLKSLTIREELQDKQGISYCYNNIGNVLEDYGRAATDSQTKEDKYVEAIKYYQKSLAIFNELGDTDGIAAVYANITGLYIKLADNAVGKGPGKRMGYLKYAIDYGTKSFQMAKSLNAVPWLNFAAGKLQKAYKDMGNTARALEYAEIYISTRDSMFSKEKTEALTEMEARYQAVKRQLEIDNLTKDQALKKTELQKKAVEIKKQRILIYSFIIGFIIILVFSIILYRLFVQKKMANILLAQQKEEISAQRDEIETQRDLVTEQKNKIEEIHSELTSSIRYAQRIQKAILPNKEFIDAVLPEYFILFKPRDIVSGDFYWLTERKGILFIAVADCTGHGVPGAFMSMLGISFLNEIVARKEITQANHVLNELRDYVIKSLQQKGISGEQKDGMDISLIILDLGLTNTKSDTEHFNLQYAGANNPLYISHGDTDSPATTHKLTKIRPDKMPIGIHDHLGSFTNNSLQVQKGDIIFLCTDGYADQFGGSKGKKFKYDPFEKILTENYSLSMEEQCMKLEQAIEKWMIGYEILHEQTDDITVMGIKI